MSPLYPAILAAAAMVVFSTFWMPAAFADYYQDFPIRLGHSPVMCAMEPQQDPQFPGLGAKLLEKTRYAVMDWNNKLNQGYGRHPVWNITLVEVPLSRQPTFDLSQCDITINYFRHPSIPQLEFVATGITIPNFEEGKTRIEIYYSGIQVLAKYVQWTAGGVTYYEYVPEPVYTGFLAGDAQLDGAIRHEIGHSLGLGHYIVSSGELERIIHGGEDMPSIMIPIETAAGVTHFDITPLDVAELRSIYGFYGIGSQAPLNLYNRIQVIQTDREEYLPGDTVRVTVDTGTFGGNESASLMALDPQNRIIDIFSVTRTNSTFFLAAGNNTGRYYLDLLDPYRDMYDFASFDVAGGTMPQFGAPVAQGPQNQTMQQNQTSSVVEIPGWVRNNAMWWSKGQLGDYEFVKGIQYLIEKGIMKIPPGQGGEAQGQQVPSWVKKSAGWWASGKISDGEFVKGIQYLVGSGIIRPE